MITIPENLPRPAEKYPFITGQRIYYMPAPRWKAPWPRIAATVATRADRYSVRLQRDDKTKTTKVSANGIAYVGYCACCEVPAVQEGAQLVCPNCGDQATALPPPDHLVARWYPVDKWTRPMAMRRAILNPDWSATEAWNDALETISNCYHAMLDRLGLTHREHRSTNDFDGWGRDYAHTSLLYFYALIDCAEGFQAVYSALVDDQKDVPNNAVPEIPDLGLAEPAKSYPFKPGEAVYQLKETNVFSSTPTLIPAIVVASAKPGKRARVAIWRNDEKRTYVQGDNLIYRGYCSFCGVPAVVGGEDRLICPTCGETATAVPPPPELTLRWYPLGQDSNAQAARECILTGCSWSDGWDVVRARHQGARKMFDKHRLSYDKQHGHGPWGRVTETGYGYFSGRMDWYAELGDEESFIAYYKAHGGELPIERANRLAEHLQGLMDGDGPGVSRRMVLPPLDIERSADDSTPDGADDLTAWLDRQFARAA